MKISMRGTVTLLTALASLGLTACGAAGPEPLRSDASAADDNPATQPLIEVSFDGFNAETTTLRFSEGQQITFQIDNIAFGVQSASLDQFSGPLVDFGLMTAGGRESNDDLDVATTNTPVVFTLADVEGTRTARIDRFDRLRATFVAPSVTERTTLNFRFRSSGSSGSRVRTIPVIIEDDAGALTLTGQASKGLLKNTKIRLFSVDNLPLVDDGLRELVEPVQIDETGRYTFTVLPATDFEDLLRFEVKGEDAEMVCDAPRGCGDIAFGETFVVEDDLDLRALIEVPDLGTRQTANINILTTLVTKRAGQLNGLSRVSPGDVRNARRDVASVFGISNQTFSDVPFVDVTQPITSRNENAVRLAMISGGILGAVFEQADPNDDEAYLDELDDFIDNFGDRLVFCGDEPSQATISIEDVYVHALEIADANGTLSDRNFLLQRLGTIRAGVFDCDFTTDL